MCDAATDELLEQMTRQEKLGLIHAAAPFENTGAPRLGIPPLVMSDGPHGVRHEMDRNWLPVPDRDDSVTYLPVLSCLAATWNRELADAFGRVLGAEARARGKDVILGPGLNLVRTPLGGRNFEYMSEDPHLTAEMAVPLVAAIQRQGTAANVKHFVCNSHEWGRTTVDVRPDERALRELFLVAFERTVKEAGVLTVMGAYNKLYGQWCCHNHVLLVDILKDEWGFKGAVISDWGGTHIVEEAIHNGLDLEMGGGQDYDNYRLAAPFAAALDEGRTDEALLDDKVRRILRVQAAIGAIGPGKASRPSGTMNTAEHQQAARRIADESLVLLKNDDACLPLCAGSVRSLAVIGDNATRHHAAGGGSCQVDALYEVTPLEGLQALVGDRVEIEYLRGYPMTPGHVESVPAEYLAPQDSSGIGAWRVEWFDNRRFEGNPLRENIAMEPQVDCESVPADDLEPGAWSCLWHARLRPPVSGRYRFVIDGGDNIRLLVNGNPLLRRWYGEENMSGSGFIELEAGREVDLVLELDPVGAGGSLSFGWIRPDSGPAETAPELSDAVALAERCDAVVIVGGSHHSLDTEGVDRRDLCLPGDQDALIAAVAAANPLCAVVLMGGAGASLPWIGAVPAVIHAGYPGMEGGHAIAAALFGSANPSGKLPVTWPKRLADVPGHSYGVYDQFEGEYREGMRHGYRGYDADGVEPLFAFGHGLSYTSFALDDLTAVVEGDAADPSVVVTFTVTNTGDRAGAEVAQVYVGDEDASVWRPQRELKGFAKIHLQPGQSELVRIELGHRAFAFWEPSMHDWRVEPGTFTITVGNSSRGPALSERIKIEPAVYGDN